MLEKLRNDKILKLNSDYRFENIIIIIYILYGLIGWQFNYTIGAILTIISTILLMLIYNNFKYSIPAMLVLLFSIGSDFSVDKIPFDIIIPVVLFVIFIIYFTIKNFKKIKLNHLKSCIGMIILSISFVIPIFWSTLVTSENSIFYIMYFSWLMYTLLYLLLCINLERDSFRMLVFSLSWLGVLIGFELIISVIKIHFNDPELNLLSYWYYIGWGLCNEAGIMLCFIMPFTVYELYKSNNIKLSILSAFKLLFLLLSIFLTTSRGSYIFGGVEFISLMIVLFVTKNDLKSFKISLIIFPIMLGGLLIINMLGGARFINDIKNEVFYQGIGINGRDLIWKPGIETWLESPRNFIFGGGIISRIEERSVYNQMQNTFLVYHSTILEVLVSGGIIGAIGLFIHFFEKYRMLFKKDKAFLFIFFIGYLMVDLYGLIDNTYGMYYYMVPLCLCMSIIRINDNYELYHIEKLLF